MILQTDSGLNENINKYGCYFMSLLFLVNKLTGMELSTARINKIYKLCVTQGWMSYKCYIIAPEKILGWAGVNADIVMMNGTHKLPPAYVPAPDEHEILLFQVDGSNYGHFVVGPYDGERVGYDPWGMSDSVRLGKVKSKRVFKVKGVPSRRG